MEVLDWVMEMDIFTVMIINNSNSNNLKRTLNQEQEAQA
jgi:hypothetical protein